MPFSEQTESDLLEMPQILSGVVLSFAQNQICTHQSQPQRHFPAHQSSLHINIMLSQIKESLFSKLEELIGLMLTRLCLLLLQRAMNVDLPKIGWIGTGVMGFSMCKHLLNSKYPLTIFNRTKSKAEPLLQLGAKWATPLEIASSVDILVLMLGFPKDIEDMCLGEQGVLKAMKKGSVLIDHTTSKPSLAVTIYEQAKKQSVGSIDAPVSGGDVGAKSGKLVTMCGGDQEDFDRVKSIMECYSRGVNLVGGPGKGQHTKMANQVILAGNTIAAVEGLMQASKIGLDLTKTIETISFGGAASTALSIFGPRMVVNDHNPGFYVDHFVKDMGIVLDECDRMQLTLPCLALVRQLYLGLKAQGGGRLGTQALIKVLENMNAHQIDKQ